jgi:hypothetical protein|mmetsp:Transcript_87912/g.138777  ORF Transcript_87912/g.138777 Transcript_87912/m.138777 type:complete len:294 (+) Transcript_87912:52-933(+)
MPSSRVPDVWCDPLASVGAILNQEVNPECGDFKNAGRSPGALGSIANYQPYTSLEEWELLKSGLSREVVPHKRTHLNDYVELANGRAPQDLLPPVESSVACAEPHPATERSSPPGVLASSKPAGAKDVSESSQRPIKHTISLVSDCKTSDTSVKVAGKMVVNSHSQQAEGQQSDMSSPRFLQDPLLHSYEAPDDVQAAVFYDEAAIKVTRVPANAVAPKEQPLRPLMEKPRVADKDRALYPHARVIRPARKMNGTSKKRLNELLNLSSLRITAGDLHPSRSFGVVPSQNLRVV